MTLAALLLLLAGASGGRCTESESRAQPEAQSETQSKAQSGGTAPVNEYDVKVEFLERFTRFIKWPDSHWSDPSADFVIAVVGLDPFGGRLERGARRWRIQGRRVAIRRVAAGDDLSGVDLLFISSSETRRLEQILEVTAEQPILTVSDTAGFGERGVLINFYLAEDSVRFEINQQAGERSGLELSSRLLKVARLVGPGSDGAFSPSRSRQ